jgi:hypothetical protein
MRKTPVMQSEEGEMTTEDRLPALPWGHLRRLGKLEAAFEEAGGRGVELAEEIDQLRRDLYLLLGGHRREITEELERRWNEDDGEEGAS